MAQRAEYFMLKFESPIKDEVAELEKDILKAFNKERTKAMQAASRVLLANTRTWLNLYKYPPEGKPNMPPARRSAMRGKKGAERSLYSSFKRLAIRSRKYSITGGIKSDHPGAGRVEWGATDVRGIRTFPHPYMNPAAEQSETAIFNIFDRLLENDV